MIPPSFLFAHFYIGLQRVSRYSTDSSAYSVQLADTETLQEQCGTESGLVQVQFVVKSDESGGYIDIIDVLKPNESKLWMPVEIVWI